MSKVALVTGASSGIGLALAKHLLSKSWLVVLADIREPKNDEDLPSERSLFVKADVGVFDDQARLFEQAFQWHGRLDFAALNAGIDDRDDIFGSINLKSPPTKPDMATFDVCLSGVYYGIKLFAHYSSRNPVPGGKIVATASIGGLYPNPGLPQYSAAKSGVIGLVRSLAPVAAPHNITINAVAPSLVSTALAPPSLLKKYPKHLVTPMKTIMRAFDELMDETLNHNGEVVEGNIDALYYHKPPMPMAPSMKTDESAQLLKVWVDAYVERNKAFVQSNDSWGRQHWI